MGCIYETYYPPSLPVNPNYPPLSLTQSLQIPTSPPPSLPLIPIYSPTIPNIGIPKCYVCLLNPCISCENYSAIGRYTYTFECCNYCDGCRTI